MMNRGPKFAADPARITRIEHLVDKAYYAAKVAGVGGAAVDKSELVAHYLTQGADLGLWPNPVFDEGFYRAQLPGPLPPGMTGLEHYLVEGAASGLDPSPLFSTTFYLSEYPDTATYGMTPLEHFVRWTMRQGWRSLPNDLPDLKDRIERVLRDDPGNPYALLVIDRVFQARITRIEHLVDKAYYAAKVAGVGGAAVDKSELVAHYLTQGAD
ncbi:hypothetical protein GTA51_20195, partial [Desulfovibrio aerotolerans]